MDQTTTPTRTHPVAATPALAAPAARAGKKNWREIRDNASVASLGLEIGLCILAGWYLGHLFDGEFASAPWGQLFFLAGGIGAAGKAVVRAVRLAKKTMSRPEPGQAMAAALAASPALPAAAVAASPALAAAAVAAKTSGASR